MPDVARTRAALQALLADNASGDIDAQDVRDLLVSIMQDGLGIRVEEKATTGDPATPTDGSLLYVNTVDKRVRIITTAGEVIDIGAWI